VRMMIKSRFIQAEQKPGQSREVSNANSLN